MERYPQTTYLANAAMVKGNQHVASKTTGCNVSPMASVTLPRAATCIEARVQTSHGTIGTVSNIVGTQQTRGRPGQTTRLFLVAATSTAAIPMAEAHAAMTIRKSSRWMRGP